MVFFSMDLCIICDVLRNIFLWNFCILQIITMRTEIILHLTVFSKMKNLITLEANEAMKGAQSEMFFFSHLTVTFIIQNFLNLPQCINKYYLIYCERSFYNHILRLQIWWKVVAKTYSILKRINYTSFLSSSLLYILLW